MLSGVFSTFLLLALAWRMSGPLEAKLTPEAKLTFLEKEKRGRNGRPPKGSGSLHTVYIRFTKPKRDFGAQGSFQMFWAG